MRLERIDIRDFRCFANVDIQPAPGINLLCGDNASGKTSVLEAIHLLGRGQSFRNTPVREMIRSQGEGRLVLHGRLLNRRGGRHRIGVMNQRQGLHYKLDGADDARRFDLVTAMPLQLIDPNLHRLFEQGPRFRRRFLDWGVFHVEQSFFTAWRQYRRALRQRNRSLRNGEPGSSVTAWDGELVRAAEVIDGCRQRYVAQLREALPESLARLTGEPEPAFEYRRGWAHHDALADALRASLSRDRRAGFTQCGPHRADLHVSIDGAAVRDHASRGQQKILAAGLLLTQVHVFKSETGVSPIVLVDDLAAELGAKYRKALIGEIERLGCQCFTTFLDPAIARNCSDNGAMFHVEHRGVTSRRGE